jgi:nucleotide-binding universal stress UspA family protein
VVPTEWIDRTPKAHPLIVVGVSPTPGGNAALEFAMSFAARDDGDILAVRAWDRHKMSSDDPMAAADRQSIVLNTMVDEAKHAHPSVTVNSQLAPGAVADALRHVAIGADLLVVGTRFTSGEYGSRLGSIASGLLHRMPCPVLVVSAGQEIELRSHASTSGWTELEQSALPVS